MPLPQGAERGPARGQPAPARAARGLRRARPAGVRPLAVARRGASTSFLDLRYFRGETLITWHYRELPRITALKYFVLLRYVARARRLGLLAPLEEDGAFGCWTFAYPGRGRVSRDLLESVNELSFLERGLGLSRARALLGPRRRRRVRPAGPPDVGGLRRGRRGLLLRRRDPRVDVPQRVLPAPPRRRVRRRASCACDEVEPELRARAFDLAVNIHSFSECPLAAIAWWVELLARPRGPAPAGRPQRADRAAEPRARRHRAATSRRCSSAAGYRAATTASRCIDDPAVRELVDLHDHFHLFARTR